MQITLMPDLHGNAPTNRIINSKHISSVECTDKQIEITMDNGTIFVERHSSHEEAVHRYDDFCILWATGDSSPELLESTRARAHGSLNWIKLEAPSNKSVELPSSNSVEPTRARARAHGSLNWIKLEAPSNKYFFKTDDVRYIKTFPSGVRIEFNDGRSTDVMMDPDKAEKVIMDMANEDWL